MERSEQLAIEIGRIISEILLVDVGSPTGDLLAGGLDSVNMIGLLVRLEERFAIRIDLGALEYDDVRSVASIARLVAREIGPETARTACAG